MKVTIVIKKEVTDQTEAKRFWDLIVSKLTGIPDLQTSVNTSMTEEELNGVPE